MIPTISQHLKDNIQKFPQDDVLCLRPERSPSFAQKLPVFSEADFTVSADAIDAVPTTSFPTPAKRPHNSRLNTTKLQSTFGLTLPHWQAGVARMLGETI